MMKAALLYWLLGFSLFACDPAFEGCLKKVRKIAQISPNSIALPISKTQQLLFSKYPVPNAIKSDPFLHLYLLKNSKSCKYPFKLNRSFSSRELASIDTNVTCGNIIEHQNGLNRFGKFSTPISTPSVILDGCCFIEAIGTEKGLISKTYIRHFLRFGGVYGDIGVRVLQRKKGVVVQYVNPFFHTPFQLGDAILELGKKKVKNVKDFTRLILFAKPGGSLRLKVERNGCVKIFQVPVYKRLGGGYLSDTFLESLGVFLDEKLRIVQTGRLDLKKGDVLAQIGTTRVKTFEDIKNALSHIDEESFPMGIIRDDFLFFIKIKTKL